MATLTVHHRAVRVMGCSAAITIVGGGVELMDRAEEQLRRLESCWSRFVDDSDVTRLNVAGGRPVVVDPATVELVTHLVQAWQATGGAFDPTLLPLTVRLGDAASRVDAERITLLATGLSGPGDPAGIGIDPAGCRVVLPAGTALDPGGLGKGLAADLVVGGLLDAGASGALVVVGGDLRVAGEGLDGGWTIAVEDPLDPAVELRRVRLRTGGVATSSTRRRRWVVGSEERHHLLDPATGRPIREVVVAATVIAGTAAWAEAWTKAVMVGRPHRVLARLDELGLGAFAVLADGATIENETWKEFEQP